MSAKCKCGHSRENHSVRGGFPFCEGTTMKACDCKGYEPQQSATHTPGPWEVVRAAAPELLEALKRIAESGTIHELGEDAGDHAGLCVFTGNRTEFLRGLKEGRAAIAKAEGGQS